MISVASALERLLGLVTPVSAEDIPLAGAQGRVLARDALARRTHPPFDASSMDGYALRATDLRPGARLKVIGEAPAGGSFDGICAPGTAVRIFTGAPVPRGADHVVMQENVRRDDDVITLTNADGGANIRPAGGDFRQGARLAAPRRLSAPDLALLAAMDVPQVTVARRPVVAVLSTGDELVLPGEARGPSQIIDSARFGLQALLRAAGADVDALPIVPDRLDALTAAFARASEADLIVSIGGASVGDHDLIAPAMDALGMERAFYKVAMRPGKPLIAGRFGTVAMVGLPGNPVSALVCATLFIDPMIARMQGLPAALPPTQPMALTTPLGPNGPRAHFMRARRDADGVSAFADQDSALLSVLAQADCLIVRPPHDPAREGGAMVDVMSL